MKVYFNFYIDFIYLILPKAMGRVQKATAIAQNHNR